MHESIKYCPVCNHTSFNHFLTTKDFTTTQEEFSIVQCGQCGFKFTNPRPQATQIGQYYKSDAYISHTNTRKGLVNQLYHLVRKRTMADKVNLVQQCHGHKPGSLLDIGCGTGSFLAACQSKGWAIKGIEPDTDARNIARQQTGPDVSIESDYLTAFQTEQFDIISMWHVLEHVYALDETLLKIKKNLKPNGTLVVAVPNSNAYDAQIYDQFWAAYDLPRHLYHFSQETLAKLLERYQLEIASVVPMKFDAFYICLLSSGYKYGRQKYVRALREGYQSNQWAKNNHNNYSSLIYLIKNK